MRPYLPLLALLTAATAACGAASSLDDGALAAQEAAFDDAVVRPYDTFVDPTYQGELDLGSTSMAVLTDSERFHAFDFAIGAEGPVRLYTLPAPDANAVVDTVMYLYRQGPRGWGPSIAKSADARGTPWSEIERELTPGVYRVLVKGRTLRVRGAFRVGFECPACLRTSECVFGDVFGKVRRGLTVKVENERLVDDASQLSALEKRQLVDALKESSHTDVTTPEEALARVDANEVNVLRLWDATRARAFVAFEYGAGDNSYGRIYPLSSTRAVAGINDGDLVRCAQKPGDLGKDCRTTAECGAGVCEGFTEAAGRGVCVSRAPLAGDGDACSEATPCGPGLLCAGLTRGSEGLCLPAWMQRTFADWQGVALVAGDAGVVRTLPVYGLATVDMDVSVNVTLRAPAPGPLTVTLTNPLGTEATVFDGESTGADLHLATAVRGFSGDESVNGAWALRVVSGASRTAGSLERWSLTVGSRFD